MRQNAKAAILTLPHHLRPEVQEQKRKDHPTLCAPQSEDFDNEWFGCMTRGGHRMTGGNNSRYGGNGK